VDDIKIKIGFRCLKRFSCLCDFTLLYIVPHVYPLIISGPDKSDRLFNQWYFTDSLPKGFTWSEEHDPMNTFLKEVAVAVAKFNGRKNVCLTETEVGVIC
jgi:hypothetical protein